MNYNKATETTLGTAVNALDELLYSHYKCYIKTETEYILFDRKSTEAALCAM